MRNDARHPARPARRAVSVATLLLLAGLVAGLASPGFAAEEVVFPGETWPRAEPGEVGMDAAKLAAARDYTLTGGGSGFVTRHGRLVMSWGPPEKRYGLKSTTKSIGATALALAIADGKIKLDDRAREHHPSLGVPPQSNAQTGWIDGITILHLATQTAGFDKPGGYSKLLFEPGTNWHYSDCGPNWLAECVALAYRRDVAELLFERVFTPLGIGRGDLAWRSNAYRPKEIDGIPRREFGSGVSANVDAMARLGYLYLRRGRWRDEQLLPESFVAAAGAPVPSVAGVPEHEAKRFGDASRHYGLLWWNNADGTLPGVPRDAFWSWGLYDSLIFVVPSLDLVASRAGRSWKRDGGEHYDVLAPFFEPLAASVSEKGTGSGRDGEGSSSKPPGDRGAGRAPYPASPVITDLAWAPASEVVRKARGSDNWPLTWADDDLLYTAYGDGWGFEPRVPRKLSLGLARIAGTPPDVRGTNLRSESAEQTGGGASGKKASGMLMVGGTLYMLVRNADNAQLAWSADRGRTWTWADWRFRESFGYPTFLNFGRDYAGARDGYVYIYSHDHASAYRPADRMVLARVPKDRLADRKACEFFAGSDDAKPRWTADIARRAAVFEHPGRCYRSGITYNAPLKRYLWCQIIPGGDTRYRGGLGIYDAPEPWGPWTTVYFTERWDIGPGETASIPTRWISPDGKTLWMAFSGDDSFSLRKATLNTAD